MKTIVIEDKQRIESIILQADACFVGITDLEGNPYVVPMNFGYENDTLYLHSGPEGGKMKCCNVITTCVSRLASDTNLSISTSR